MSGFQLNVLLISAVLNGVCELEKLVFQRNELIAMQTKEFGHTFAFKSKAYQMSFYHHTTRHTLMNGINPRWVGWLITFFVH